MINNEIVDYLLHVEREFARCFLDKNYHFKEPVPITSGIDESVTLIGSSISVLKPYFLEKRIEPSGMSLIQKSMRTRNIKNLCQPTHFRWGSFFTNMGCLVPYSSLNKICEDLIDYLIKYLLIPEQDIMVRCNSEDKDLCNALGHIGKIIRCEYDTRPHEYYRHKYGLDNLGIYGRNFNIALRDKLDGEFKDIGNVIVIESNTEKYGVEFGIGSSSIVMCEYGLTSAIQASRLAKFYTMNTIPQLHYADSLIGTANLIYEDAKRIKEPRFLRSIYSKYKNSLCFWMNELGYDKQFTKELMEQYLSLEYEKQCKINKEMEERYLNGM